MRKKQIALKMFFSGLDTSEIIRETNIDKQTLSKWATEWIAEKQMDRDAALQSRLDYINAVEKELFNEIEKNPQNTAYINNLVWNYKHYLVV